MMRVLQTLLVIAVLASSGYALAEEQTKALANEIVITGNPLHENVAEKYIKEATGEIGTQTIDQSDSAFSVFVPLDDSVHEGTVVTENQADKACQKLKTYIRKLRQKNADNRVAGKTQKLVYNFQCSPNIIINIAAIPNDSRFRELWGLNNTNNIDMDLPEAWDKSTGSKSVVVAVIDTGVDYNHPDLAANMWKNPAELNGSAGIDDDGNGIIDDIYGYNAITNSGNPMDDHYHGTHCAGTIGATGNNSTGVVGVSQNVQIMAVKFLSANGGGSLLDSVKAIDYVTNQKIAGVNVVASNNSWGYTGPAYSSLQVAIQRASDYNILFVAAAGNNSQNNDNGPNTNYPASYNIPNVISVGAIDSAGAYASFSNYGVTSVDIVAPGVSILSTTTNNNYGLLSGTSMATPHVTGAIALMKSYASNIDMITLRDIVFSAGKSIAAAVGKTKFAKMPSAYEMLLEADRRGLGGIPPTPAATATPRPTATMTPTPTATSTPTATPTTAPGYWTISGKVSVGSQNMALAKVILNVNGQTYTVYTDAQGSYTFNNVLGPSAYTLAVVSAGQQFSGKTGNLTGNLNTNFSGVAKNYLVSAKVIDQSGMGVAGVVVGEPSSGAKLTDSNGIASFSLPYGRQYELSVDTSTKDFLESELGGTVKGDVTRVFVLLPN